VLEKGKQCIVYAVICKRCARVASLQEAKATHDATFRILANKHLTGKQNEWQGKHEHMRPDQSQISFQACTRRVTPPSSFFELLRCLKRRNATAAMMTKATPAMLMPAEEIDQ
jgi:hypothetical protein